MLSSSPAQTAPNFRSLGPQNSVVGGPLQGATNTLHEATDPGVRQPHAAFRMKPVVQEDIAIDFHAVSRQCVATGVLESSGVAIKSQADARIRQPDFTLGAKAVAQVNRPIDGDTVCRERLTFWIFEGAINACEITADPTTRQEYST